ncbi:MAG: hypothetical protein J5849_02625 [Clostridia bacterium]|nr:hypothetical protein [Clostridia bacterium]
MEELVVMEPEEEEKELARSEDKRRRRRSYDHREEKTGREIARLLAAALATAAVALLVRVGALDGKAVEEALLSDGDLRAAERVAKRLTDNLEEVGVFLKGLASGGPAEDEPEDLRKPGSAGGEAFEKGGRYDLRY